MRIISCTLALLAVALWYSPFPAQRINVHPEYDTLAIYGPDYAPSFKCKLLHFASFSADTIIFGDRIAILQGFRYNPQPPATPIWVDTLCFDVTDSTAFNQYELWFRHTPPIWPVANGQISFDTALTAMPGEFDITVKIRRNGILIDSAKQSFISYMVGAVQKRDATEPLTAWLYQNYPNPFNPTTEIRYQVQTRTHVFLGIYSLLGQLVITLVDEEKQAGEYSVPFNATGLTSGPYYCQLRCGRPSQTRKLLLLQ